MLVKRIFIDYGMRGAKGGQNAEGRHRIDVGFPVSYPSRRATEIADCLTSLDDVIAAQGREVERWSS